jgi:hypothetical protein
LIQRNPRDNALRLADQLKEVYFRPYYLDFFHLLKRSFMIKDSLTYYLIFCPS